ncbi:methionine synthase [Blastococcus sp. Marseille-P5729]|uniref:methionine synthase n=1 Tax=Blastococcus sp. Marseille-P5729 TaxID=2086582 RepID=UPI000D11041C|nr:methionine synthase [Blastococcus sp. Marseille-P5729]
MQQKYDSRFLEALDSGTLVADGAMGTMLQSFDLTLEDFDDLEGCNEILNITRPDVVRQVHEAYLAAGAQAIETNTFGANYANLLEYDIPERIYELAEAGARIAREAADAASGEGDPRFVLGSVGPGTKLPTLGHAPFATLRDAYQQQTEGMLAGGIDAVLMETCQDLLQAKAAVIGAKRAMAVIGRRVPIIVHVTVETTGTMLLGSEIGAALNALAALGIDMIGLNCATGPDEMSEHLRYLSTHSPVRISVMPNAGLPELGPDGAVYPLGADDFSAAVRRFVTDYGVSLVGGCCGTTPDHISALRAAVDGLAPATREPVLEPGISSLYQNVPYRQDAGVLLIGERTNTNGSKAFREALIEGRIDDCVEVAKGLARDGSHVIDLCVDYVGRDGAADMGLLAERFATATTLPIMLDSTEVPVIEAGLERLGGRCIINSVNLEDGDGEGSRWARLLPIIVEHGAAVVALTIDEEGQARTAADKVRIASRMIDDLHDNWGIAHQDIMVDTLTFTVATGQEESRRDAVETIEGIRQLKAAYPEVSTTLGLSNVSFGLNPAARQVLNSVFLHECQEAGLDSAILHASKILPMSKIPDEQREVALDLVYDRRRPASGDEPAYDPLTRFLEIFEGVKLAGSAQSRAEELAALPLDERLKRRIIDGERAELEADLDEAMQTIPPLQIINELLLDGMKTVGELFGSGQMQLPFVLQSAEVMKSAVAHLEPHMEKTDDAGKGTIVLATVKGDVHDIGKNLVDIILSNNGYTVVNLGIKQPVNAIIDAAIEHNADAVGMSGLLVKSTVVMKENLEELNARGLADRFPVVLGGAALTRAYVEDDLDEVYQSDVYYARDAFEGLRVMDTVMALRRGQVSAEESEEAARKKAERKARRERSLRIAEQRRAADESVVIPARSDVATDNPVPTPPFWGSRVIKGVPLADYASMLDERATFMGQWGLRGSREGASYDELVETEGRPRLRQWLDRVHTDSLSEAAVVYGYFPCVSEGDDVVVLNEDGSDRVRFTFPRQRRDRHLCLADFFRSREQADAEGRPDVIAFDIVTMGSAVSAETARLFAADSYREYMELHGLSVQLTEALAEYWHQRIRSELVFDDGRRASAEDPANLDDFFKLGYRGARFAFGYPACPDLEQQTKLIDLLEPSRIGVELSEGFQLHPEQSTSALVCHHPEAKYFAT